MRFDSDKTFDFLMRNGVIATMRMQRKVWIGGRYTDLYIKGMIVIITRNGKRIGKGIILNVVPNTLENREKYVSISGFETVEEWEKEARRLHRRIPNVIVVLKMLYVY